MMVPLDFDWNVGLNEPKILKKEMKLFNEIYIKFNSFQLTYHWGTNW